MTYLSVVRYGDHVMRKLGRPTSELNAADWNMEQCSSLREAALDFPGYINEWLAGVKQSRAGEVSIQLRVEKGCHCEGSEAISI
ncbi:MAG TPA: hypothetical protein VK463_00115 [Desulfomonilaceae bacterium]|nr:hypothetical protein [Desulfomonilaceae bacterium]